VAGEARCRRMTVASHKAKHTSPVLLQEESYGTRILERQKMLQTGQVLFRRLSVDFALVLHFKDSSEAAEPRCSTPIAIKLPDTPRRSEAPSR
jgi:hypothetical protein